MRKALHAMATAKKGKQSKPVEGVNLNAIEVVPPFDGGDYSLLLDEGCTPIEGGASNSAIKRPWIDNHDQAALQRRITDDTSESSEPAQDSALAVLKPKGTKKNSNCLLVFPEKGNQAYRRSTKIDQ
ncbi:hypothetical protein KEM48_011039 [Puccinia striiformis f. sp. tritici PST-130]|nr:hypothetical protein KEM48_011039 [Puccinia striiformis f. sp. tritici PST-130]